MFSVPPRLFAAALALTIAFVSTSNADEISVRVDEDLAGEHPIADLRSQLSLDDSTTLRLVEAGDSRFRIDEAGWLVLGENVQLDFESEPVHHVVVEVVTRRTEDAIRDRFASLATNAGVDRAEIDELHNVRRLTSVKVLLTNRPERPRMVSRLFTLNTSPSPETDAPWGRAVAVDEDQNDELRYELLDGSAWFRIDPATGMLFFREQAAWPAVATIMVGVAVTDTAGLADHRDYAIRLVGLRLATRPMESAAPRSDPDVHEFPQIAAEQQATLVATAPVSDVATSDDVTAAENEGTVTSSDTMDQRETATSTTAPVVSGLPKSGVPLGSSTGDLTDALVARTSAWIQVFGWFVWSFVAVGVVIIISSGMRAANTNRVRPATIDNPVDRVNPLDPPTHSSRATFSPPMPSPEKFRAPKEIEDVLARLSESFGDRRASSTTDRTTASEAACSGSGIFRVDDLMTRALSSAGLMLDNDPSGSLMTETIGETPPAAPVAAPAIVEDATLLQSNELLVQGHALSHPCRRRTDTMTVSERDSLEEFRLISRQSSRAEINRHHLERMRDQWMSVGIAALACLTTGSACVFTKCFGQTSLPVGLALIAVSAALLMRRSLYPPVPRRRASDFIEDAVSKSA